MSDRRWPVEFRFGGLGGQGLVTLGAVLASAAAQQGLNVAASQSYGSRARGGATRSDVIVSAQPIDFPHVHRPEVLVVLAQEAYDLYAQDVCQQGLILADAFFVTPNEQPHQADLRQHLIPATKNALEKLNSRVAANFVMLGATMGYTALLESGNLLAAIDELVRERFVVVNKQALELGWALGQALRDAEVTPWA